MYLETALQVDMQNPDLMLHLAKTYRAGEQWAKAKRKAQEELARPDLLGLLLHCAKRQSYHPVLRHQTARQSRTRGRRQLK